MYICDVLPLLWQSYFLFLLCVNQILVFFNFGTLLIIFLIEIVKITIFFTQVKSNQHIECGPVYSSGAQLQSSSSWGSRGGLQGGGDGDRGSSSCRSTEFSLMVLLRPMLPPIPKLLLMLPPPPLLLRGLGLLNAASPPPPPRLGTPDTSGGRERGGRVGSEGGEGQRRRRESSEKLVAKRELKRKQ